MSIQLSLLPREQLHSISQIVNAHLRLVSGFARQFGNAGLKQNALWGFLKVASLHNVAKQRFMHMYIQWGANEI